MEEGFRSQTRRNYKVLIADISSDVKRIYIIPFFFHGFFLGNQELTDLFAYYSYFEICVLIILTLYVHCFNENYK